jgi:CspA family cold shock protein
MARAKGKVKWFSNEKGYGFIQPDDGGRDVFVHHTAIETEERGQYRTLDEGDEVEFEVTASPKGPQAENVVKVTT